MDEKDLKILEILMENARTPKVKIAEELKVTETAIRKRIAKLEDSGIIIGYRAVVNCKLANLASSLTGLDVEPEKIWSVVGELKVMRDIKSMWLTTGDHTLMLEIITRSVEDLLKIHKEIEKIDGVRRVCPSIVLEILK